MDPESDVDSQFGLLHTNINKGRKVCFIQMTFCFYLIDETLDDNQVSLNPNDTTVHSNTGAKRNQDDNPLECMLQIF
jgi:hypothetical protein